MSFGFKYGVPLDADRVVLDAPVFLPNPHWIPELQPKTGQDPEVRDYVLGQDDAGEFLDRYTDVLRLLIPGLPARGKALRDPRCRLYRWKASQRRDRRGVRPPALRRGASPPWPVHRDLGREVVGAGASPGSPPRVVALGGGHGLGRGPVGSGGGSPRTSTAVVTVADDGGSSGRHSP